MTNEEAIKLIRNADYTHEMSDDPRVSRAGRKEQKKIESWLKKIETSVTYHQLTDRQFRNEFIDSIEIINNYIVEETMSKNNTMTPIKLLTKVGFTNNVGQIYLDNMHINYKPGHAVVSFKYGFYKQNQRSCWRLLVDLRDAARTKGLVADFDYKQKLVITKPS